MFGTYLSLAARVEILFAAQTLYHQVDLYQALVSTLRWQQISLMPHGKVVSIGQTGSPIA